MLYSVQLEKHLLAGLIQNPEVLSDIESFLNEKVFVVKPHDIIFSCLRSSFFNNEKIDKVILAQKIQNLGISFKEDVTIFDYIDAISFSPVSSQATIDSAKELAKLKALRDIEETCENIKKHVNKATSQQLENTIAEVDDLYGKKIDSFDFNDEPQDLLSDLFELVEERGNKPVDEIGLVWPYPEFNKTYGGARSGDLYAIAARAKAGKSTWLNYTAIEMGKLYNCPVLFLDTEMNTTSVKFRTAASYSGVPMWFLESGNFRKSKEFTEKVRKLLPLLKNRPKVYHYYVGNKTVDQISSIIKRWILSVVGKGNKCVVVYDYLKLTGEKIAQNWAEYQAIGDKINKLKELANKFNFPLLTAVQLNRTGINTGKDSKDVIDDDSAIAQSDRLAWFGTYVGILRRRTVDEILLDGQESGTHKLIEVVARFQGKDAKGHQDLIKRTFLDGKSRYVKNFINFNIDNFKVEERGSLKDCIIRQNAQFLVQDEKPNDGVKKYVLQETL